MSFNFFRKNKLAQPQTVSNTYKSDGFDQRMTEIAIDLINGYGGSEFRTYFISLFKDDPRFIENVAPEYREALQRVLASPR